MNIKTAFQDSERAVSPVIGVILMVAITVILAAVIGTFVLGLGDQLSDTTPQASFSIDDVDVSEDTIEVTKTGGQDLAITDLRVVVDVAGDSTEFDLADLGATEDDWRTADTAIITVDDTNEANIDLRDADLDSGDTLNGISASDDITVTIVHKQSGGTVSSPSATA